MPIDSRVLEPGIAVVTLSGRLVFGKEVERLESVVKDLVQHGHKRFVFDAAGLEYTDSSGIGTLVACLTQIKTSGGDLRLAAANPRIQRLLTMTGVDKLMPLYPTVAEAAAGGLS
jgi:anti-sigma B factor antagonist